MARAGHSVMGRCSGKRQFFIAFLLAVVASLILTSSSVAAGNYNKFSNCPYLNPEASKCISSTTIGGEVALGSTKVPIVNPTVLQGAYASVGKGKFSKFIGASNGVTLSAASQPIPGGLLGIAAPQGASSLVKAIVAVLFENDLTKASASLELARPASAIRFSEANFGGELGTALKLPVKVHLNNPLLGPSCYIGSSSSPINWDLTSGTSSPPKPTKPIKGTVGAIEFLDEGRIIESKGTKLVDNAWSIPAANGCGGPLSFLVSPIVNDATGLPALAGASTAILENRAFIAPATVVKKSLE